MLEVLGNVTKNEELYTLLLEFDEQNNNVAFKNAKIQKIVKRGLWMHLPFGMKWIKTSTKAMRFFGKFGNLSK